MVSIAVSKTAGQGSNPCARAESIVMNKISAYFKDSYKELMEKVTWPNWTQLQQSTTIVLVATAVITALVWVMDFFSNSILKFVYSLFK